MPTATTALTTLSGTIYPQTFMEAFLADLQPLSSFTRDFTPDAAQRGNVVKIPFVDSATDAIQFGTAGYEIQANAAEGLDLTINRHFYVSFDLSDRQLLENPQLSVEMFVAQKAHQLAKKVVTDVLSIVTQANFGSAVFTGAASTFDSDDVVDIKAALDLLNMPKNMRSLVLDSAYSNALLKDSEIKPEYSYGSTQPIVQGQVPRLMGFDMFESTIIPGNSENLTGFAAYPDAAAVAMRYHAPQDGHDYAVAEPFTDPQGSGVTIGYRAYYDNKLAKMIHIMDALYGFRVINGNSLRRIISA